MKQIISKSKAIQDSIRSYFDTILPTSSIIAVYLFGSYANGTANDASDIDIGVYFEPSAYKKDPIGTSSQAYLAAAKTGMDTERKTDITFLNTASLEIAYEVITTGILIVQKDLEKRLDYEIALKGMYFDFRTFLLFWQKCASC